MSLSPQYSKHISEPTLTLLDWSDHIDYDNLEEILEDFILNKIQNANNIVFVSPVQKFEKDGLNGAAAEITLDREAKLPISTFARDVPEDEFPSTTIPFTYELEIIKYDDNYVISLFSYRTGVKEFNTIHYQTMKLIKNTMDMIPAP
ncbi:MAG: hypothetical protein AAF633_09375 [Chloroflexota bacterium]